MTFTEATRLRVGERVEAYQKARGWTQVVVIAALGDHGHEGQTVTVMRMTRYAAAFEALPGELRR